MRELGYRPNSVARALATGRTQHARSGQLRHDAVRPRVDAVRDRAGGPRGRLLHDRRQPQGAEPLLGHRRSRAAAGPRRRRHPRDRPAPGGRRRAPARSRPTPAGGGRGRVRTTASQWWRSISSRARSAPPDISSTSATRRCGTSPGRPTGSSPGSASRVGARRSRPPAPSRRHRWPATGARVPGYDLGRRLSRDPGRHGDLRRQRPDGARGPAGDARGRPRAPGRGQRGRVRRHPRGAVFHAAADDRAPGLHRGRQPQPAAAACG